MGSDQTSPWLSSFCSTLFGNFCAVEVVSVESQHQPDPVHCWHREQSTLKQGEEIWDWSPSAGSDYSPALWLVGSAVQSGCGITSRVLVPKLVLIQSGQLPLAAEPRWCGLQPPSTQPRCSLHRNRCFHGSVASGHEAKLPSTCVILLNSVGPLPWGKSSRIGLCSITEWKLLGSGVQLHLQ